jgi:flagellar protein FlaG
MDMDVGLTSKSTPSSALQLPPRDKAENAGQEERRPADPGEGAEPRIRAQDSRVARIDQLQRMAEEAFSADNLKLSIKYNKEAGRFVYRGLDPTTGEVVREYPPEEVLERMARLRQESAQAREAAAAGVSIDKEL